MAKTQIGINVNIKPKRALEILRGKGKNLITTQTSKELSKDAHDKAFTVATVMNADILQEVFNYVQAAMENGEDFNKFKKKATAGGLIERMQQAGWTGKTGSRLRVIYDTNISMAYAKAEYERRMQAADAHPYWIYRQIQRESKRPEHAKLNGKKFRADDPIWHTIYPPSGFGCGCTVEATNDPTGCISGSDLKIDSSQFPLSPLDTWQPDTSKYSDGIRQALQKQLQQLQEEIARQKQRIAEAVEQEITQKNAQGTGVMTTQSETLPAGYQTDKAITLTDAGYNVAFYPPAMKLSATLENLSTGEKLHAQFGLPALSALEQLKAAIDAGADTFVWTAHGSVQNAVNEWKTYLAGHKSNIKTILIINNGDIQTIKL